MADTKIEVRANGPLRITGPIEIVDHEGKAFQLPEGQFVSKIGAEEGIRTLDPLLGKEVLYH